MKNITIIFTNKTTSPCYLSEIIKYSYVGETITVDIHSSNPFKKISEQTQLAIFPNLEKLNRRGKLFLESENKNTDVLITTSFFRKRDFKFLKETNHQVRFIKLSNQKKITSA